MSTYCKQIVTVFGRSEDLRILTPAGYCGHDIKIEYHSETRNGICFDMKTLSNAYSKLIFVVTTRIETQLAQRDLWRYGENIIIESVTDDNSAWPILSKSHPDYCKDNNYLSLLKLFNRICAAKGPIDELDMDII